MIHNGNVQWCHLMFEVHPNIYKTLVEPWLCQGSYIKCWLKLNPWFNDISNCKHQVLGAYATSCNKWIRVRMSKQQKNLHSEHTFINLVTYNGWALKYKSMQTILVTPLRTSENHPCLLCTSWGPQKSCLLVYVHPMITIALYSPNQPDSSPSDLHRNFC